MEYVYHGSKTKGLKVLIPHESTHGKYIYATNNREIAIIMAKQFGDDATYSLELSSDGKYDLVERIPHAFEKMFTNEFSLYTVDASTFKDLKTGFNEVVSDTDVEVLKEEHYDNLIDAVNDLAQNGLIHLYRYSERPNYIPKDDSDIIDKIQHVYIEKYHKVYTGRTFARWIFLHPNLEDEFRLIAKKQGVDLPSYDEIYAYFNCEQKLSPNNELFVESAREMKEIFDK